MSPVLLGMQAATMGRGRIMIRFKSAAGTVKTQFSIERKIEMKTLFALATVLSGIAAVSPSFAASGSGQLSAYGDQVVLVNRVTNQDANDNGNDKSCRNPFDFHCPSVNGG